MDFEWVEYLFGLDKGIISHMFLSRIEISWWKMLLLGFFLLLVDFGFFVLFWLAREENVIEYGFPRKKRKAIEKLKKSYSLLERLFMINITLDANRKGFFLLLNLMCHFLNLSAMFASIVGFIGCMITLADGWCLTLLLLSEIFTSLFSAGIMFVPDLIWLPSERRRYSFLKKRTKESMLVTAVN